MEKYSIICLLWMRSYISLFANAFTQWINIGASCLFYSTRCHNGVDTIMTLETAKWNCTGGDLSSCVTNSILLEHVSYYSEHFWNKFTS